MRGGYPHGSTAAGVTIDALHRADHPNPPPGQRVIEERTVTLRYSRGGPSHHVIRVRTDREHKNARNGRTLQRSITTQTHKAYEPRRNPKQLPPVPQPKADWTAPMYQLDAFVRRARNPLPPGIEPLHPPPWVEADAACGLVVMMEHAFRIAKIRPDPPGVFCGGLNLARVRAQRSAEE